MSDNPQNSIGIEKNVDNKEIEQNKQLQDEQKDLKNLIIWIMSNLSYIIKYIL